MIIEQVRYFAGEDDAPAVHDARLEVDVVRRAMGLPEGIILVADPVPDDGPAVVWQCAYRAEGELAVAEAAIAGSAEYGAARDKLAAIINRVEIELYTAEDERGEG